MPKIKTNVRKLPGGGESYDLVVTGEPDTRFRLTSTERAQIAEVKQAYERQFGRAY